MGPGRVRPYQEEGRNAGAHPERKPIRGSGKTADFKPATFHGFRNVAEISPAESNNESNNLSADIRRRPSRSERPGTKGWRYRSMFGAAPCGPSHFNPRNYWGHPQEGRGATGCLTVPGDPSMQPVPALTTPSFKTSSDRRGTRTLCCVPPASDRCGWWLSSSSPSLWRRSSGT